MEQGLVSLVGAGPGSVDLLTMRSVDRLREADVVVADRLAPAEATDRYAPHARVIPVGKNPYHHPVPQPEINRILVEESRAGHRVVRLKGGDPYVFGRGGEELLACRAAGVPVEVIPGVTSVTAAPAVADIPVTHRGISTGFLVISGHDDVLPEVLARWPHTIIILMGTARLHELCTQLIDAGKDPETPAAIVKEAWLPGQEVARGTLRSLPTVAEGFRNPATVVIGNVVAALEEAPVAGSGASSGPGASE